MSSEIIQSMTFVQKLIPYVPKGVLFDGIKNGGGAVFPLNVYTKKIPEYIQIT